MAFTTPLATLPATAAAVGAGPGGRAWIFSGVLAGSGLSAVTPLTAGHLSRWITPRGRLVAGLPGCTAGQLALMGLQPHDPVARLMLAGAANGVRGRSSSCSPATTQPPSP